MLTAAANRVIVQIAEPEGFGEKKKRKRKDSGQAGQAVPVQRPRNKDGVSGAAITDYFKRVQPGTSGEINMGDQPGPSASGSLVKCACVRCLCTRLAGRRA